MEKLRSERKTDAWTDRKGKVRSGRERQRGRKGRQSWAGLSWGLC